MCRDGMYSHLDLWSELVLTEPGTRCISLTQTLERRKQLDTALKYYNKAIEVSPENALVRYRRAKMMVSMRRYNVSLVLLPIYAPTVEWDAYDYFFLVVRSGSDTGFGISSTDDA